MTRTSFSAPTEFQGNPGYKLLPFRFLRLDSNQVVVVNEVGEFHFLSSIDFNAFARRRLSSESAEFEDLKAKHFLYDGNVDVPLMLLSTKYRTKRQHLSGFTRLHIFVVTLRCDHTCKYCQVSRANIGHSKYDMSETTAHAAIECVFRSPSRRLKIEFQGGEPLLNFPLIKWVIEQCEYRAAAEERQIDFVITTNSAFLDEEILTYLKKHLVAISTSLDGPEHIHNANRPRPGADSYTKAVQGIGRARQALGDGSVSALMTTTRLSLDHPTQIIDEYLRLGFDRIFLRPLSPYGFAVKTRQKTGYEVEAFLDFYRRALDHIIAINRKGTFFVEIYSQLLLTRILTPFSTGYVDLQSPAGAGISVAVYNYDGGVYATDESRMLAEMGDETFRLGTLGEDSYEEMFGGQTLRTVTEASCVESLPGCSECAFQTYCGSDPVENYATQGDIVGHRPTNRFCARNMGVIKHLLGLYRSGGDEIQEIFWSWIHNSPRSDLVPAIPE